jgi:hypothetical protein
MKRHGPAIALTAFLALASGPALASSCPKEMKAIDDALPAAKLDMAKMDEVKKLRAEGEAHHKAGRHAESMAALAKAKAILGIK